MTEQRVTLETAKLAKEKGFDIEYCQCGGFPECICTDKSPTQSLLQKWLREKYYIEIEIKPHSVSTSSLGKFSYSVGVKQHYQETEFIEDCFTPYEDALEVGLQEALKLIPEKK